MRKNIMAVRDGIGEVVMWLIGGTIGVCVSGAFFSGIEWVKLIGGYLLPLAQWCFAAAAVLVAASFPFVLFRRTRRFAAILWYWMVGVSMWHVWIWSYVIVCGYMSISIANTGSIFMGYGVTVLAFITAATHQRQDIFTELLWILLGTFAVWKFARYFFESIEQEEYVRS